MLLHITYHTAHITYHIPYIIYRERRDRDREREPRPLKFLVAVNFRMICAQRVLQAIFLLALMILIEMCES